MGEESSGVVSFDLVPFLQGQMRTAKLKIITCLLLVLELWDGRQPIGNHGLGIFWCGQI